MSKYPLLFLYGLRELLRANDDWYAPSNNRWVVVNNGFLGGQVLYDHSTKKVYALSIKEIPNPGDDFLEMCDGRMAQLKVERNMNYAQAKQWLEDHPEAK